MPGQVPPAPHTRALFDYLDRLAGWSREIRASAGVTGPWLPEAIRHAVTEQWWGSAGEPPRPEVVARIARFWVEVTPWLPWHPDVSPLPLPPRDRALLETLGQALDREGDRAGAPVIGWDRGRAFREAASMLRAHREPVHTEPAGDEAVVDLRPSTNGDDATVFLP